jgi:hypothetical protein
MALEQKPTHADLFAFASHNATSVIPQGEARFVVEGSGLHFNVKIKASDSLVQGVAAFYFEGERPEPETVMTLNYVDQTISIFPQLIAFSDRLYRQKYRRISEIQVDCELTQEPPTGHYDVVEIVKCLPNGFLRDPAFGMGMIKEMRPLINSIESIETVTRLVISENETTHVSRGTFWLNAGEYRLLQQGMSRISRTYQAESLADRRLMAHNASIHRALPEKYLHRERAYRPGTVFKLLGGSKSSLVTLRGRDRLSVLEAIASNAAAIADRDPKEFVQLQKDIEVVSLDKLIEAVGDHITRNCNEGAWQTLLELNPFILTMLFGQPIVLLQPSAFVGGQTLAGTGTKISDFLTKNSLTNNAALVEIKRPKTQILANKEYRGGVFAPSNELMASVSQVLDQRLKLVTGIAQTRYNSTVKDLEVSAVECIVVAGRTPNTEATVRSLELFRSSLKDVRIITFDELLEKLQILRELLAGERYVSNIPDDGDSELSIFEDDENESWSSIGGVNEEEIDPAD